MFILFADILDIVFREIINEGFVKTFRARLNIIGHSRAGKTSLLRRLLGQPFKEDVRSTEGITIHTIKSDFYMDGKKTRKWNEMKSISDEIMKEFYFSMEKQISQFKLKKTQHPRLDDTELSSVIIVDTERTTELSMKSKIQPKLSQKTRDEWWRYRNCSSEYLLYSWDFGGQAAFIATHHFFLDVNCETLIVMDITKDLQEPVADESLGNVKRGVPQTSAQYLCYWLQTIHTKASAEGVEPNIALVLTHKDLIKAENTKQYIDKYIGEILELVEGKPYSAYISRNNVFVADNKTKIPGELNSLRHKIFKKFRSTKSWGQEIPARWLKFEVDLLRKSNSMPYLHVSDTKENALIYGMDKDEVESFLAFHHSLGSLVHYNDPALRHIIISKPQWLVDQFKALITTEQFLDGRDIEPEIVQDLRKGIVTKKGLDVLWKGNDVEFLTALMIRFNLMLFLHSSQTSSHTYIIPCMLPDYKANKYAKETFMTMDLVYNSSHKQRNTETIPVGTYQKLVCRSARRKNWELRHRDHLSYTDASFWLQDGIRLSMTLLEKQIRISVWCDRTVDFGELRNILPMVRKNYMATLTKLGVTENNSFGVLCPYSVPGDQCLVSMECQGTGHTTYQPGGDRCLSHNGDIPTSKFEWLFKAYSEFSLALLCEGNIGMSIHSCIPCIHTIINISRKRSIARHLNYFLCLFLISEAIEDAGQVPFIPLSKHPVPVTMYQNWRKYNATVSNGETRILQGYGSDVSLNIPDGTKAVYMMKVHTDHFESKSPANDLKFKAVITSEECIIGPPTEVEYIPLQTQTPTKPKQLYRLKIAHCLSDQNLWEHIIVRRGDVHRSRPFREVPRRNGDDEEDVGFEVDNRYITIHTDGFSQFICTCGRTVCTAAVMVFIMGNPAPCVDDDETTIHLKNFLCSPLYKIEDYKEVLSVLCALHSVRNQFVHLNQV